MIPYIPLNNGKVVECDTKPALIARLPVDLCGLLVNRAGFSQFALLLHHGGTGHQNAGYGILVSGFFEDPFSLSARLVGLRHLPQFMKRPALPVSAPCAPPAGAYGTPS